MSVCMYCLPRYVSTLVLHYMFRDVFRYLVLSVCMCFVRGVFIYRSLGRVVCALSLSFRCYDVRSLFRYFFRYVCICLRFGIYCVLYLFMYVLVSFFLSFVLYVVRLVFMYFVRYFLI